VGDTEIGTWDWWIQPIGKNSVRLSQCNRIGVKKKRKAGKKRKRTDDEEKRKAGRAIRENGKVQTSERGI